LADNATWTNLIRIGGPIAWMVVGKAFKSKDAAVRRRAVQACAETTFAGDESIAAVIKAMDDDDESVRAAAIQTVGIHANWRSQPAQVALAKCALNARKSDAERLAATTALAAVLPLPFLGNFSDDPAAFQGITALLNADNEALRVAAFAPIPEGAKQDFGYQATAVEAERKRSIIAWQEWYAGRIGLVEGKAASKR
jgi:HEAT repeat protein